MYFSGDISVERGDVHLCPAMANKIVSFSRRGCVERSRDKACKLLFHFKRVAKIFSKTYSLMSVEVPLIDLIANCAHDLKTVILQYKNSFPL